ncbi:hypothetical protein [Acinetobacter bereziniae]|nr:hypothetical protein [Acinetobacter bereziniae]
MPVKSSSPENTSTPVYFTHDETFISAIFDLISSADFLNTEVFGKTV